MQATVRLSLAMVMLMGLMACASGDAPPPPSDYSEPPAGSPLTKVEAGMNDVEVRKILGDPDDANAYMTGKAWIPLSC